MESSKSIKKAVLVSVISAAVSVLITFATKKVLSAVANRRMTTHEDAKLTTALEDSMDCSDAVAKY